MKSGSNNPPKPPSRRALLKSASLGAALAPPSGILAQQRAAAVITGRKFRGWVSRGYGPGRTRLEELTLRPIAGRQVLVRTEASSLCYSNCSAVLGLQPAPPAGAPAGARRVSEMPLIQGHGGVGVVEAVGPEVRRVRVGDRVAICGTPQCGSCYMCLRGRSDMCQFLARQGPDDLVPMADLRDGTPVFQNSHIGGLAELMVTFEEWVAPVFTKASAVELGMVSSCVSVAGLGATTSQVLASIGPAASVAVVGCGPLGLSAVQGARIAGAARIIAIDPIKVRRELALKLGATHALDPVAEGPRLVQTVRALTAGPTDHLWAGGRYLGGGFGAGSGPDFVVEAAGAEQAKPKLEAGPDPTGIQPLTQAWEMTAPGGHLVTTSLVRGNIILPGTLFTIGGKTHHSGQAGGCSPLRDLQRFVELMDAGRYDAKALATRVVPLAQMLDAYEEVLYRTTVTAIMTA